MEKEPKQGLWDEHAAAEWLGLSVRWMRQARLDGNGPPYLKISRSIRYHPDQLEAWALEHQRRSTAEYEAAA